MDAKPISDAVANTAVYGGASVTFISGLKNWLMEPGNVELVNFGIMAAGLVVAVVGLVWNIRAARAKIEAEKHCTDCPLGRKD